jgi:hypothetical protein
VHKLIFGAFIHAADRWRGLRFTALELRQLADVSGEQRMLRILELRTQFSDAAEEHAKTRKAG